MGALRVLRSTREHRDVWSTRRVSAHAGECAQPAWTQWRVVARAMSRPSFPLPPFRHMRTPPLPNPPTALYPAHTHARPPPPSHSHTHTHTEASPPFPPLPRTHTRTCAQGRSLSGTRLHPLLRIGAGRVHPASRGVRPPLGGAAPPLPLPLRRACDAEPLDDRWRLCVLVCLLARACARPHGLRPPLPSLTARVGFGRPLPGFPAACAGSHSQACTATAPPRSPPARRRP
jgi:hypothetical protein